ncbi:hypothetical protein HDV57DRAFT_483111 [Trichoderma longibrachiatum]
MFFLVLLVPPCAVVVSCLAGHCVRKRMYLAAGTPPFSGASIWASIFFDALATQHAWTCLSGSITAYVGARMHVSSKQASRHRRFGKSPPPPALGRPGHGAGFFLPPWCFCHVQICLHPPALNR